MPPAVPFMPLVALPGPLDGAGRVLSMLLLEPEALCAAAIGAAHAGALRAARAVRVGAPATRARAATSPTAGAAARLGKGRARQTEGKGGSQKKRLLHA